MILAPPLPPCKRFGQQVASPVPLPLLLCVFWAASAITFGLMFFVAWLASRGVRGQGWHPLGAPSPFLGDLLENQVTFRLVHTQAFWGSPLAPTIAYPPFGGVMLGLFYATGYPSAAYILFACFGLVVATLLTRRALIAHGIDRRAATLFPLTIAAVSFPIEGLLQRGNLELMIWAFAALGTWMFLRGHQHRAAIFWGLAAAIKFYPIIFLVLFWPRRHLRAALLGVASFLVATGGALLYLGPTLRSAWFGWLGDFSAYQHKRAAYWTINELAENHSFFMWVKTVAIIAGHGVDGLMLPYYFLGGLLFVAIFVGRLSKLPIANQLLGVTTFMLLLPAISAFYTLVHLYAPLLVLVFLMLKADRAQTPIPGLSVSMLLFLPLFASYTLFTFRGMLLFGGLIHSACLAVLLLCSLHFRFSLPPAA